MSEPAYNIEMIRKFEKWAVSNKHFTRSDFTRVGDRHTPSRYADRFVQSCYCAFAAMPDDHSDDKFWGDALPDIREALGLDKHRERYMDRVQNYINNLPWTDQATDHEKTLVAGNVRQFAMDFALPQFVSNLAMLGAEDQLRQKLGIGPDESVGDALDVLMQHRDHLARALGKAERFPMRAMFSYVYWLAYKHGHEDTVEGRYTDVFQLDQFTYWSDEADEIIQDSGTFELAFMHSDKNCEGAT